MCLNDWFEKIVQNCTIELVASSLVGQRDRGPKRENVHRSVKIGFSVLGETEVENLGIGSFLEVNYLMYVIK